MQKYYQFRVISASPVSKLGKTFQVAADTLSLAVQSVAEQMPNCNSAANVLPDDRVGFLNLWNERGDFLSFRVFCLDVDY